MVAEGKRPMDFSQDYVERVYAGVLGKIIGVYLGRPFEGWSYERIMAELGEVNDYVHHRLGAPLIVADDDISGTFTFLRALEDYGFPREITPQQIGQTWLNYLIPDRTVLWWGGLGNSTEHTAYIRLRRGIPGGESGSMRLNGKVVSEQIGAQIFIDGWGMVAPGDPEWAADLARRAASVSHDGEAIYGAQVVAAMESLAFVERDLDKILDVAVGLIPGDSVIRRMIDEIREWRAREPDWRRARELLEASYGYDKYGGNCHIVPNHGLIILSLLYGDDDFRRTLMIVNTCGWDTDCNSGNVGCFLGIKNGLEGIDQAADLRGPVADRLYLPSADGARCITDAVRETYHIVNAARALQGLAPQRPKHGARFHFELPGAVQGFQVEEGDLDGRRCEIENVIGYSQHGARSLGIAFQGGDRPIRVGTLTFLPPDAHRTNGYGLMASPTLYPGQTVRARVTSDPGNPSAIACSLYGRLGHGGDDETILYGPARTLKAGEEVILQWVCEDPTAPPIRVIGIEIDAAAGADGSLYLDYLTWEGVPTVHFGPGRGNKGGWQGSWVNGVDSLSHWCETFRLVQNEGVGLAIYGAREWDNYAVQADVTPHMVRSAGVAVRVQGMRRYYALILDVDGFVRLVKELDGRQTLFEAPFAWSFGETYELQLAVNGNRIRATINQRLICDLVDEEGGLESGAIALLCEEGRTATQSVALRPI